MSSIIALTAYDVGSWAGLAALAALLVALVVRVLRTAPATAAPASGGLAAEVTVRPARRRSDVIAMCVVAVWLVAAIGYTVSKGGPGADPWDSAQGVNLRAGFIDGCEHGGRGIVDCGCVFTSLRSDARYDTPDGFANLGVDVQNAASSGDPKLLPAGYLTAVRTCRR
jgi:hypothetical protein